MKYTTKNGILMLKCYPLNWRVEKKYYDGTMEINPDFYVIAIGGLSDMWQAGLDPDTMVLSFASIHYSSNEVYRFKVDSIEEASEMALKFAKGMRILESLDGTIYWNGE
jgi:hypothetical protein